jgi:hypothetical protein
VGGLGFVDDVRIEVLIGPGHQPSRTWSTW